MKIYQTLSPRTVALVIWALTFKTYSKNRIQILSLPGTLCDPQI